MPIEMVIKTPAGAYVAWDGSVSPGARDSNGNIVPMATGTLTYGYTGGNMTTVTLTDSSGTWKQNYTYNTDGTIATSSQWVKQ